uniref:Mitochondrial cardiolipin hydrolase n=1 Tax=Glossina brevipalpis TaxID=37001 RepID=A0A1A9X0R2_9MUSC
MGYFMYGTLLILLSEAVYHSYQAVKNWHNRKLAQKELWSVILTNELTLSCPTSHQGTKYGYITIPSNSGKLFDKISVIERGPLCSNAYCMDSNFRLIKDLLYATKYSIDLAMFTITSVTMARALAEASLRGVIVRVITDANGAFMANSQILYLLRYGVGVRHKQIDKSLMHHKFCVLDSPSTIKYLLENQKRSNARILKEIDNLSSVLMTGSLNWTTQGFSGNYENVLLTNQKQMIQEYSDEFQNMWELLAPALKPQNVF